MKVVMKKEITKRQEYGRERYKSLSENEYRKRIL